MSVSLSDSLLDLNCSATPNDPAAGDNRGATAGADTNTGRSVENEGAVGGSRNNAINEGASGSRNNGSESAIAGPSSRMYVPIFMEVDEDYREFCEQFGFEVHFVYFILEANS